MCISSDRRVRVWRNTHMHCSSWAQMQPPTVLLAVNTTRVCHPVMLRVSLCLCAHPPVHQVRVLGDDSNTFKYQLRDSSKWEVARSPNEVTKPTDQPTQLTDSPHACCTCLAPRAVPQYQTGSSVMFDVQLRVLHMPQAVRHPRSPAAV